MNENHIHIPVVNVDGIAVSQQEYEELSLARAELQAVYTMIETLESYSIKDAVARFRENLHGTGDKEEADAK